MEDRQPNSASVAEATSTYSLSGSTGAGLGRLRELESALAESIKGKPEVLRLSLVALLSRGHLLIEDVPGVGKTTLASAIARAVHCGFHRVQCTSDMLPSDIIGVSIYSQTSQQFEFKPGPVFTNFLLADEVNRATPKTQSALLEAMNERQVTVDGRSYPLNEPFMVIATQNPAEHHGTYPLPESQLDRFLMRIKIGYPDKAAEREILRGESNIPPRAILSAEELIWFQRRVESVAMDDAIADYLLAIVERTRRHDQLTLGLSPRGAQALYRAAQASALLDDREFVIPDDVKRLASPVCAHRLVANSRTTFGRGFEAVERILDEILAEIEVPL